jgi:hypothetical protein
MPGSAPGILFGRVAQIAAQAGRGTFAGTKATNNSYKIEWLIATLCGAQNAGFSRSQGLSKPFKPTRGTTDDEAARSRMYSIGRFRHGR